MASIIAITVLLPLLHCFWSQWGIGVQAQLATEKFYIIILREADIKNKLKCLNCVFLPSRFSHLLSQEYVSVISLHLMY